MRITFGNNFADWARITNFVSFVPFVVNCATHPRSAPAATAGDLRHVLCALRIRGTNLHHRLARGGGIAKEMPLHLRLINPIQIAKRDLIERVHSSTAHQKCVVAHCLCVSDQLTALGTRINRRRNVNKNESPHRCHPHARPTGTTVGEAHDFRWYLRDQIERAQRRRSRDIRGGIQVRKKLSRRHRIRKTIKPLRISNNHTLFLQTSQRHVQCAQAAAGNIRQLRHGKDHFAKAPPLLMQISVPLQRLHDAPPAPSFNWFVNSSTTVSKIFRAPPLASICAAAIASN